MRIALISRRFDASGGGTERDLLSTGRILAAAGHQLTVYADEVRGPEADLTVRRVSVLPFGRALRFLSFGLRAARMARRSGAEMVLSFARVANADIMRSGGGAHVSYVRAARQWQSERTWAAMRLSPYHRAQIALERVSFKSPKLLCTIAVSELVRHNLIKTFALPPSRVITLYNGVDLRRFVPGSDKYLARKIRSELGVAEGSRAVAFIGHGFARKGLGFLLEAWPQVDSRACLLVAGTDRAAAFYHRRAIQLGIGHRVIFVGPRSDVDRLFSAADGVVLPSLFEPFGNVVMEAMASGLPVLCSRQTGAAELIPPELHELVIDDPTDINELAARVNLLVRMGRDVSRLAREAAEQFTWERYGAELLAIVSKYHHNGSTLARRPCELPQ
jgi:UDP-glucose:(heptosyl)LPS alpha-1,3-glucosyltransferase